MQRDIFNAICFGERVVDSMSTLLHDDVTLYHRKLVMKDRESSVDAGWAAGNAWEVSSLSSLHLATKAWHVGILSSDGPNGVL